MITLPFSDSLRLAWGAFVDSIPEAWWWHRAEWLDYCLAYRPGAENRSFAVVDDVGAILAICPLIREGADQIDATSLSDQGRCFVNGLGGEFAMGGEPGTWPVASLQAADVLACSQRVYGEVDRLACAYGVTRLAWRTLTKPMLFDHYAGAGYRDISWSTRVLDLTQPEALLWRGVRKGHRADIRKAEKTYYLTIGPTVLHVLAYERLHREAHGNPRPPATYRMQDQWARDGIALISVAVGGGDPVAVAYFNVYKQAAYYSSSAALIPDVMAAVVWHGILALKVRGVKTLELGWQNKATDEKGKNVEHFKRGFGGTDVPVYAVEKVFTPGDSHAD